MAGFQAVAGSDGREPGPSKSCSDQAAVLWLIPCPQPQLPAEVTDRFTLGSTDGPVVHVALCYVAGHYFQMALDMLPASGNAI
jgi:hypothetical protein